LRRKKNPLKKVNHCYLEELFLEQRRKLENLPKEELVQNHM